MNDSDDNVNNLLGSASFLSILQFIGQLKDSMADGIIDNHEVQQLLLSATSAIQTLLIVGIAIYMKFFRKKK